MAPLKRKSLSGVSDHEFEKIGRNGANSLKDLNSLKLLNDSKLGGFLKASFIAPAALPLSVMVPYHIAH